MEETRYEDAEVTSALRSNTMTSSNDASKRKMSLSQKFKKVFTPKIKRIGSTPETAKVEEIYTDMASRRMTSSDSTYDVPPEARKVKMRSKSESCSSMNGSKMSSRPLPLPPDEYDVPPLNHQYDYPTVNHNQNSNQSTKYYEDPDVNSAINGKGSNSVVTRNSYELSTNDGLGRKVNKSENQPKATSGADLTYCQTRDLEEAFKSVHGRTFQPETILFDPSEVTCPVCGSKFRLPVDDLVTSLPLCEFLETNDATITGVTGRGLCSKHAQPCNNFCTLCFDWTCDECPTQTHRDHVAMQLTSKQLRLRDVSFMCAYERLTHDVRESFEHVNKHLNQTVREHENERKQEVDKLNRKFRELQNGLLSAYRTLRRDLEIGFNRQAQDLHAVVSQNEAFVKTVQSNDDVVHHVMNRNDDAQILQLASHIPPHLSFAQKQKPESRKKRVSLHFTEADNTGLDFISMMGRVNAKTSSCAMTSRAPLQQHITPPFTVKRRKDWSFRTNIECDEGRNYCSITCTHTHDVIIGDNINKTIQMFSNTGNLIQAIAFNDIRKTLSKIDDVASINRNEFALSDASANQVLVYNIVTQQVREVGAAFANITGLTFCVRRGLYVIDAGAKCVVVMTLDGKQKFLFRTAADVMGRVNRVAVDFTGDVVVTEGKQPRKVFVVSARPSHVRVKFH